VYVLCKEIIILDPKNPRMYPYLDAVMGLAWSRDPENYAGDRLATGRVSNPGQVICDDREEKRYSGPPCWDFIRIRRFSEGDVDS
jgi:hypothetical protein